MHELIVNSPLASEERVAQQLGYVLGRVTLISPDGKVLVDFEGNEHGALAARLVRSIPLEMHAGDTVLLLFEQGDLTLPLILGTVTDRLPRPQPVNEEVEFRVEGQAGSRQVARLDGKRLVFEAREEIVLRCGKSSITLRKDGKILVKGKELVSHATGTNRVKGSSVAIN